MKWKIAKLYLSLNVCIFTITILDFFCILLKTSIQIEFFNIFFLILQANVQFYKFVSNEYRFFPIKFEMKLKNILKYKPFDIEGIFLNYSTPPMIWPIKKGLVSCYIQNWITFSYFFFVLVWNKKLRTPRR